VIGLLILATTYGTALIVDYLFFDYGYLHGETFYDLKLDPHGPLDARSAVATLVASAGGVLALASLDFWPVTKLAAVLPIFEKQPWRGVFSLSLIALMVSALWVVFLTWKRMDIAVFQARVCVSFIFGLFTLLVMFRGEVFTHRPQPLKGLLLISSATLIAIAAYSLYHMVAIRFLGLEDLLPSRELENWVSTVMLAITFPGMAVFADHFDFWPLSARKDAMNSRECVPKKALAPQKSLRFERANAPSADVTVIRPAILTPNFERPLTRGRIDAEMSTPRTAPRTDREPNSDRM
jgi:hypothetical protein